MGALLHGAAPAWPRAAGGEDAAARAGVAAAAAGDQPGAGSAGHVPCRSRSGRDPSLRALDQGDDVEAAAAEARGDRIRRRRVRLPAQGPRGPAAGRARDAALRPGQHAALVDRVVRAPRPRHPALQRRAALYQQRADRVGAAVRHAALARARLPRAAFDLAQCGAPADASLRARPRDALADAEGGGLQARPRQHERHGSLPGALAQGALVGSMARAPLQLLALACGHVDGGPHAGAGRPPPVQPDALQALGQDPTHRLRRLLRGRDAP
mmetsp:Transcript_4199/g.11105  ORF Transcript_4199/g.11105 Transcript_4199/m.11105 type:complete len:269 (+) Transcript_4199:1053-1859(+)